MCALEPEDGFAFAPDGRRIFYRVAGKGPYALVMPANWGVDSYIYTRGLSSLEFWLALLTFDPRGVGRSDPARSEDEYAMEVTARDGAAVADRLLLRRSVVMGHSSGGAVALTYALAFPDRVSHLVLISTAARWRDRNSASGDIPYPASEDAMRREVAASMQTAVHHPSKFTRAMEELLPRMRFSTERFRWTGEVEFGRYDVRDRLREIRAPVLIVHGREDRVIPVDRAEELRREIGGSRLEVLAECGHWPFVERRQDFVAVVTAFLGLNSPRGHRPL